MGYIKQKIFVYSIHIHIRGWYCSIVITSRPQMLYHFHKRSFVGVLPYLTDRWREKQYLPQMVSYRIIKF